MEKAVFDDYAENRYKKQMDYYSKTSVKNQKRYKQFQWILIVLSAITPVLAALLAKFPGLQIAVVITSAIVAILTTGLKTFSYQELWITYRVTYEKLKPEIHYYNFNVGPYSEEGIDKESLFVARVEAILDAEHTQWPPAKKLQEDQNKQQPDAIARVAPNDNINAAQPEGEQPADVAEPADAAPPDEADETREIVDESGETGEIVQAGEVKKDVQPGAGPKQT